MENECQDECEYCNGCGCSVCCCNDYSEYKYSPTYCHSLFYGLPLSCCNDYAEYKYSPAYCHYLFALPLPSRQKVTTNKTDKLAQLLFSLGAEVFFFNDWVMCINGIEVTYGYGGHIYSVDGEDCKIRYGKPMTEMFAKKLLKKVNTATYSTVYSAKIRWTADTISWD